MKNESLDEWEKELLRAFRKARKRAIRSKSPRCLFVKFKRDGSADDLTIQFLTPTEGASYYDSKKS